MCSLTDDALRDKYVELVALAEEREHARADGLARFSPDVAAGRRARMRALAGRFPGALRELQSLPVDVLRERLVVAVRIAAGEPRPVWLVAVAALHEGLLAGPSAAQAGRLASLWDRIGTQVGMPAGEAEALVYGPGRERSDFRTISGRCSP
jgi:hypothetical protein